MVQPEGLPAGDRGLFAGLPAKLPEARLVTDAHGAESRRFGSATSGQVLLYDPAGRLVFAGGITPARGDMGDSFGRETLMAATAAGASPATGAATTNLTPRTPVFGCPLFAPNEITSAAAAAGSDDASRPACHIKP
jgi:hypothetical protein